MGVIQEGLVGTGIGASAGLLLSAAYPPVCAITIPGGAILGGGLSMCDTFISAASTTTAKIVSYSSLIFLTILGTYYSKSYLDRYREANCQIFTNDGSCYIELASAAFYSCATAQLFNAAQTIAINAAKYFFPSPIDNGREQLKTISKTTVGLGLLLYTLNPYVGAWAVFSGFVIHP